MGSLVCPDGVVCVWAGVGGCGRGCARGVRKQERVAERVCVGGCVVGDLGCRRPVTDGPDGARRDFVF